MNYGQILKEEEVSRTLALLIRFELQPHPDLTWLGHRCNDDLYALAIEHTEVAERLVLENNNKISTVSLTYGVKEI